MREFALHIHVVFGYLFLVILCIALFSRKRGQLHRISGIAFTASIAISSFAAFFWVLGNGNFFLLPICMQTLLYAVIGMQVALQYPISLARANIYRRISFVIVVFFFSASLGILLLAERYDVAFTQATYFLFTGYILRGRYLPWLSTQRYHSVIMIQLAIGGVTAYLLSTVKPHWPVVSPTVIILFNTVVNLLAIWHFRRVRAAIQHEQHAGAPAALSVP